MPPIVGEAGFSLIWFVVSCSCSSSDHYHERAIIMNQDVAAACAAAKYNESVLVTITVPSNVDARGGEGLVDHSNALGTCGDGTAAKATTPDDAVVTDSSSAVHQDILLVASLDKENGGVQWNDVSALEDPIERHFRTKIWLLPMLNDHRRNLMYQEAIQRATQDVVRRWFTAASSKNVDVLSDGDPIDDNRISDPDHSSVGTCTTGIHLPASPGTIIRGLDIGSGTGLLAMMSARYLKESFDVCSIRRHNDLNTTSNSYNDIKNKTIHSPYRPMKSPCRIHITSLEMSSPMATLAQRVVALNGYSGEGTTSDRKKQPVEDVHDRSGVGTTVDIVEGHSCAVHPMKSSVEDDWTGSLFCTSELLESGLLGEGWLPAMRDAWERHLDPINAIVVPQRARVYAQVVEGEGVSNYWGPHKILPINNRYEHVEGSPPQQDDNEAAVVLYLNTTLDHSRTLSDGHYDEDGNKDGIQVPIHLDKLLEHGMCGSNNSTMDNQTPIRLLSDPIEVLEIDVTSKDSIPLPGQCRSQIKTFVPTASGRAQGIVVWWEVDLYQDLTYTTKPGASSWQDHWHQCLYVFPKPFEDCVRLVQGHPATIIASHTDTRLRFSVEGDDYDNDHDDDNITRSERTMKRSRPTIVENIPVVSPHRCWQLNDLGRSRLLRDWIQAALDVVGRERANVLDISDFSLCGMMASLLGANKVTSVESSSGNLPLASARVAQLANGLIPPTSSQQHNRREKYDGNTFQVIQCHAESLTVGHLHGVNVGDDGVAALLANVVVGEPYYETLEGWCIEEALNFFYTLRMLRRRNVVSRSATCVPARASIMACGIECPDIAGAYQPCDAYLAGFDHSIVREYCHFSKYNLSLPLWEYTVTPMTGPIELALLDYEQNRIVVPSSTSKGNRPEDVSEWVTNEKDMEDGAEPADAPSISVETPYIRAGICHAVMLWVEYGSSDCSPQVLSTNTRSYKQAVRMLLEPVCVEASDVGTLSLALSVGDLLIDLL